MKRKCTVNCQKFLEANFEVIKNPLYKRVVYTEEYGLSLRPMMSVAMLSFV